MIQKQKRAQVESRPYLQLPHFSRNTSTDSQQEVRMNDNNRKMMSTVVGRYARVGSAARSRGGGGGDRLPSLDGCLFECENDNLHRNNNNDEDDQDSIDSQIIDSQTFSIDDDDGDVVQENDSDSDDDDDSILSQVKDMAAVETATYQVAAADTIVRENIVNELDDNADASDDDSLTSIVSKAYSMTSSYSSTSYSEESSSSDVEDGRKRVVFVRQQNEVHYIPNRREYTPEEIKSVWYQHQDMAAMVKSRYEEVAFVARQQQQEPSSPSFHNHKKLSLIAIPEVESFSEELGSSSLSLSLKSPLHAQHLAGAFDRKTCKPTDAESEARIHAVIDAVMDEQETQWLDEFEKAPDPILVAQASLQASKNCARDAMRRGHLDALEAIPIYMEREQQEPAIEEEAMDIVGSTSSRCSGRMSSSSSSRTITSRTNTERQRRDEQVYPLSPMSVSPKHRLNKLKLRARSGKKSSSSSSGIVSECRWTAATTNKRALVGNNKTNNNNNKLEDRRSSILLGASREKSDDMIAVPKRMASIRDLNINNNSDGRRSISVPRERSDDMIAVPKRMASVDDMDCGSGSSGRRSIINTISMSDDIMMKVPKRMASIRDMDVVEEQDGHNTTTTCTKRKDDTASNNVRDSGLSMPRRMASNHTTDGMDSKSFSICSELDSELEFATELIDYDDDEELASPPSIPESVSSPVAVADNKETKKMSLTYKFFSKNNNSESSSNRRDGGIYHKMKRKLKGSTKTKKKKKKDEDETKNKRRKKSSKTTKTKKKKTKGTKSSPKQENAAVSQHEGVVVDAASQPSGLSDEFEQLDTSCSTKENSISRDGALEVVVDESQPSGLSDEFEQLDTSAGVESA